jgi:hypothetical protein
MSPAVLISGAENGQFLASGVMPEVRTRFVARGTHHGPFGIKIGAAGQASLPAMVVRASRRLPRSPRVSQR